MDIFSDHETLVPGIPRTLNLRKDPQPDKRAGMSSSVHSTSGYITSKEKSKWWPIRYHDSIQNNWSSLIPRNRGYMIDVSIHGNATSTNDLEKIKMPGRARERQCIHRAAVQNNQSACNAWRWSKCSRASRKKCNCQLISSALRELFTGSCTTLYTDDPDYGKMWKKLKDGHLKKVPTRTGPCCAPSACNPYRLAPDQRLHLSKSRVQNPKI